MLSESISIGVVSGVISSALIGFFTIVYQEIVKPKLKRFLYSGIDLAGEWKSEGSSEQGYNWKSTINIEQNGEVLKGDIL